MNVTRQTVSSWERGRTLPDIEAVRKLSALLECDFSQAEAEISIPAADERDDKTPAPASEAPRPDAVPARKLSPKVMWIIAGAAVLVCVCLAFFLRGMHGPNSASKDVFSDEYYQQVTPNDPEKAYLVFENVQWQEKGENQTFDRYNFKMHEKNGIGMDIVSIELKPSARPATCALPPSLPRTCGPPVLLMLSSPMGRVTWMAAGPRGNLSRWASLSTAWTKTARS